MHPGRVVISYAHDDPAHEAGVLVRELPLEALIGRRAQLRTTMAVLRRAPEAVRRLGAASGVQLTGVAGIGKSAVAGRVISRLRDDGWLIAVHQGRWNPAALISATARAISDALPSISGPARAALAVLTDPDRDDVPRLEAVAALLRGGHASLRHVRARLENLARAEGFSLDQDPSPARAFDQAMLLGNADILLDELLKLRGQPSWSPATPPISAPSMKKRW